MDIIEEVYHKGIIRNPKQLLMLETILNSGSKVTSLELIKKSGIPSKTWYRHIGRMRKNQELKKRLQPN